MIQKIFFIFFLFISFDAKSFDASNWNYSVPLSVNGATNSTVVLNINFRNLLNSLGDSSNLDNNSIRIVRPNGVLVTNQEYIDSIFNNNTDPLNNSIGQIRFILEDNGVNTYTIYFDSMLNGAKPTSPANLINGVFEFGTTGQRDISGWLTNAAANYDAQLRPSETPTISSSGVSGSRIVNGNPESGLFSYLLGSRTNNNTTNIQSTRLRRTINVPSTNPGFLRFSYRIHGWDSGVNNNLTQYDYFSARVISSSGTTHIVGPAANNYTTFPFSPNYGLSEVSNTNSGYGKYNGFDCDLQNRRRRQGSNPNMTIPCEAEIWLTPSLNLTPFAGQAITLEFITHHVIQYKTWVHLDNVEWSVITGTIGSPTINNQLPHSFDVIEPNINNPSWVSNNRRPIYTKLAFLPFNLDVVALNNLNLLEANYESSSVLFEIYVNNNTCNALTSPIFSRTFSFSKGISRVSLNNIIINGAYQNLIVKITDLNNNISNCSSDIFSVRPQNISFTATGNHFNPPNTVINLFTTDPTGTNSNTANIIGSGQPFNLIINTNTPNYNGTPILLPTAIDWTNVPSGGIPYSTNRGVGQLNINSTTPANPSTGNNANINVTYTDVGYFKFLQSAINDRTWTSVDIATGDCTLNSSNSLIGNRYGCYLESAQTTYVGRFIPTQIIQSMTFPNTTQTTRGISQSCTPNNTYFGEPTLINNVLEARNALNQITRNYHGSFARVSGINWHAKTNTTIYDNRIILNSPNTIAVNQGLITYTGNIHIQRAPNFSISLSPDNPTDITIGSTLNELDGIRISSGAYSASNITPNVGALHTTNNYRFGRIRINNIRGSDIIPQRIPITIEYYQNGSWLTNANENCLQLMASNFSTSNFIGNIQTNELTFSYPTSGLNIQNGRGYIIMNKPSGGDGKYSGSFQINYNINSFNPTLNQTYLGTKNTTSNLYNENPFSIISLGRTNRNNIIFLKQNF